jgi:hypothetical protein
MVWNSDWNGPTSTDDRKPLVGDPPWIHAFADGVEIAEPERLVEERPQEYEAGGDP